MKKQSYVKTLALFALSLFVAGGAFASERPYYFPGMGIEAAWEKTRGSEDVVIASLSTGVNYHLPEFRDRLLKNSDGSYGFDAFTGKTDGMDVYEFGLGTQVASIAVGNTLGLAPGAKLLPVRIFDENGTSNDQVILRGIEFAIANGARILELGGGRLGMQSETICRSLLNASARGILVVVPAGNEAVDIANRPIYGCEVPTLVMAAGADENGNLAAYSTYGFPAVHVAAFSDNIWGMGRDGEVKKTGRGTSFSAALTSGVAALVWSAHPEYSAMQVKAALIRGSVPTPGLRGKVLANGFLNALGSIGADVSRIE